jgi:hypothetical protein
VRDQDDLRALTSEISDQVDDASTSIARDLGASKTPFPTPIAQAGSVVTYQAVTTAMTVLILRLGYLHPIPIPTGFLLSQLFGMAIIFAVAFTELFLLPFQSIVEAEYPSRDRLLRRWQVVRVQDGPLLTLRSFLSVRGAVWLAAGLNFFATVDVITKTGGGIVSPFTPLLLAPAVLGPFIVMRRDGLVALELAAVICIFYVYWKATHTTAGFQEHARWWAYPMSNVSVAAAAALAASARLSTLRPRRESPD